MLLTIDVGIKGCGACLYDIDTRDIHRVDGVKTSTDRRLRVGVDDLRRLKIVLDFLQPFRDEGPVGLAFESPGGSQSAQAAKHLATGRTAAFMIGYDDKLDWRAYTPGVCKKAAGMKGNGPKDKKITQKVVTDRWPMAKWPLGEKNYEDACDAAAVIIAAELDGFVDLLRETWKHLK